MKASRHVVCYSRTLSSAAVEIQLEVFVFALFSDQCNGVIKKVDLWLNQSGGCPVIRTIKIYCFPFRMVECLLFLTLSRKNWHFSFKPVFLYRNAINHILSQDSVHPNKSCL